MPEPSKDQSFRLQRCMLSVPAIRPDMFPKGLASGADVIMLDCEDSVAANDKDEARTHVIQALNELDFHDAGKTVTVRINAPDTPWMYRDLVDIAEQAGERVDAFLLPKAESPGHVEMLDCLLGQIEAAREFDRRIGIEVLIETVRGAQAVDAIAAASTRLEALHFGAGDFAASCGARTVSIGGLNPDYPGDPWHGVMQRIVIAARANGLRPIDAAFGDFNDDEGFIASVRRAAAIGFSGKWAIHPRQIPLVNEVMTPSDEEVKEARRILEAMDEAAEQGLGAVVLDGKMVDVASIRMAAQIVRTVEKITHSS